jgi:phosphatidate cytidylyltransferase
MLYEWISINSNKLSLLFVCGCFYIILAMLFWIYEARYFPYTLSINILWIITIVCTCDIFAYIGGSLLKGPKLAHKISPFKTWSGVITGVIFSFLSSQFFIRYFMDNNHKFVWASVFVIIGSIIGDLIESKAKRILNVKDTGRIIPGHGGVCDRLDSFILATYIFIILRFSFLP